MPPHEVWWVCLHFGQNREGGTSSMARSFIKHFGRLSKRQIQKIAKSKEAMGKKPLSSASSLSSIHKNKSVTFQKLEVWKWKIGTNALELLESQTTILSDRRLGSFKLSSKVDGGGRKGARADDDISKTILHTEGVLFLLFLSKWYYEM